jgi:hypothetical protein
VSGGLTWLRPDATTRTYAASQTYCSSTAIDGQTGWRLPTQSELQALHAEKGSNVLASAGWRLDWIWSSTPYSAGRLIVVRDVGATSWANNDNVDMLSTTCVYPGTGGAPLALLRQGPAG